ncbi:MAG: NFACT RNA binding domain-containing protein [Bacillales bacterium]|jgi:predicted ribosome quality control (RQC) complex YloA/Tae2 family protein|nr:NFACT RNA binding domain-containing protein [Bacillales bacterium]
MDGLFFYKLTSLLRTEILESRIHHFDQISKNVFIMELNKGKVIFNLNQKTSFFFTQEKYESSLATNYFLTTIRSKINKGLIKEVKQLNYDRILQIKIERVNDIYQPVYYDLIIELTGNRFNICLLENEKIIVSLNPRSNKYALPLFKGHKAIFELIKEDQRYGLLCKYLFDFKENNNYSLTQLITLIDNSNTLFLNNIYPHFIKLVKSEEHSIKEGLYLLFEKELLNTTNSFITPVLNITNKLISSNLKRISIIEQLINNSSLNDYLEYGKILLTTNEQELEECIITYNIPYNRDISIIENSNYFFKLYKKEKGKLLYNRELLLKLQDDNDFLQDILVELSYATPSSLTEIKQELVEKNFIKFKNIKKTTPKYLKFVYNNTNIYVGLNALQNEYLTFKIAKGNDTFLHVHEYSGSHVIINSENPDKTTLEYAGALAKKYSKASDLGKVQIDYTLVKYLKKIKEKRGKALLKNYSSFMI